MLQARHLLSVLSSSLAVSILNLTVGTTTASAVSLVNGFTIAGEATEVVANSLHVDVGVTTGGLPLQNTICPYKILFMDELRKFCICRVGIAYQNPKT
jgi:hypothetical protein